MPIDPKQQPDPVEKSLGDQATGADVSRTDEERSLGDQSTTGDALSSLSDLGSDLGEAIDSDLPLIDLAARYEIEGELGKGGMGAVLLATDRQLKRKVAIKRILGSMSKSKTALQRFVTEAQSIAKLNHFNIVQVHEFGRDAEGPFLVLEYVGGGSLLDKLKNGKLEVEEAVDITCQLCDALDKAHGAGIIHRDIKPANILLTEDGAPKLTDFGLARQDTADHGQTQAGAMLGTIDFMSTEQRRDATAADARSDLWSLAATLYQMITGEVPRVIDLDAVPQNLRSTFTKALKQNPDERYATAEEFKAELRKGLATAAATVSADLAAGVCPTCNASNDASRKFCRGCRASLIEPCLSCETDNPVWEDVCGECGSSQQEKRELVRTKLSDTLEASLTLAREHEYEHSLMQLKVVQEDQHPFTEDIRQQAAKQVGSITAQRNEQRQLRDQLVELANQHQQAHDYRAVVRELEKIPVPLRTGNQVAEQLCKAQAACDELATLEAEIHGDVKNKQIEELLEKTARFLELNPGHEKIHALHQQLLQRQRKAAAIAAALEEKDFEKVLSLDPANTEALKMKAEAEEAAAALKKKDWLRVLELDPGNTEALKMKAEAEEAAAIAAALANKDWPRVLELDPTNSEALCLKEAAFKGHTNSVVSVAFSPDGKRIVSGSYDETLRIWDANSGQELRTLEGHTGPVNGVSFSPDGKRIVSGSSDKTVRIWNSDTGKSLQRLKGRTNTVYSVAFSPDGKRIVSGSFDKTVRIWDADTGKSLQRLKGHTNSVFSVAFSPDGKRIVSGSGDETLRIWDADSGKELRRLKGRTSYVRSVAFSPDGKRIVSGSEDSTLRIWDANSGQELRTLKGHTGYVSSVAFSPDGKRIFSVSGDKTVRTWDANSGQELQTLEGHIHDYNCVAVSPDGKRIVSGSDDNTLKLWPISSLKP